MKIKAFDPTTGQQIILNCPVAEAASRVILSVTEWRGRRMSLTDWLLSGATVEEISERERPLFRRWLAQEQVWNGARASYDYQTRALKISPA